MRIAIVNDMPMAVEALRRALALTPEHQVVWVAEDGAEAVERCAEADAGPGADGPAHAGDGRRRGHAPIMASTPCAILIVTASVGANTSRVFEAMGHGALDAVDTPALGSGDPRAGAAPLLAKIDIIGKLIGDKTGHASPPASAAATIGLRSATTAGRDRRVGRRPGRAGHRAARLAADFPAAIVIVQHVDEQFAAGMAEWLSQQSDAAGAGGRGRRPADGRHRAARRHQRPPQADGGERLGYTREPQDYAYRPSVDVFFHSVEQAVAGEAVGVLLTGMGSDGAQGLKALRDRATTPSRRTRRAARSTACRRPPWSWVPRSKFYPSNGLRRDSRSSADPNSDFGAIEMKTDQRMVPPEQCSPTATDYRTTSNNIPAEKVAEQNLLKLGVEIGDLRNVRLAESSHSTRLASRGLLCSLALFGAVVGGFPAVAEETDTLQPLQELFQTETVYPQERGELQATLRPSWRHGDDEGSYQVALSSEYGLTDAWQVGIEWDAWAHRKPDGGESRHGVGDVELNTKYNFMNINGSGFHAALAFGIQFPVGDIGEDFSEGFVEYEPSVILAKDFPRLGRLQVFTQLALSVLQRVRSHDDPADDDPAAHETVLEFGVFRPDEQLGAKRGVDVVRQRMEPRRR